MGPGKRKGGKGEDGRKEGRNMEDGQWTVDTPIFER